MNDRQLDMVLGYLNEGTSIDEVYWLYESIQEEIDRFNFVNEDVEVVNEGEIGEKIKSSINKIIEFIQKCIDKILNFIRSIKNLIVLKSKQVRIGKNDIIKILNSKKLIMNLLFMKLMKKVLVHVFKLILLVMS